jgi:hypothetical protein
LFTDLERIIDAYLHAIHEAGSSAYAPPLDCFNNPDVDLAPDGSCRGLQDIVDVITPEGSLPRDSTLSQLPGQ